MPSKSKFRESMDVIDQALKRCDGPFEHSPLLCGMSEETDCPVCLIKYWPLRRQDELEERLTAAGIDSNDLAELLFRPVQPKIEKIILSVVDAHLRSQQLAMMEAFFAAPARETLREHLRDLLFDDIVAIVEAVLERRTRHARKVQGQARRDQKRPRPNGGSKTKSR